MSGTTAGTAMGTAFNALAGMTDQTITAKITGDKTLKKLNMTAFDGDALTLTLSTDVLAAGLQLI